MNYRGGVHHSRFNSARFPADGVGVATLFQFAGGGPSGIDFSRETRLPVDPTPDACPERLVELVVINPSQTLLAFVTACDRGCVRQKASTRCTDISTEVTVVNKNFVGVISGYVDEMCLNVFAAVF